MGLSTANSWGGRSDYPRGRGGQIGVPTAQKYYDEVLQYHSKKPAQLEEKEIKVSDQWLAQLQ